VVQTRLGNSGCGTICKASPPCENGCGFGETGSSLANSGTVRHAACVEGTLEKIGLNLGADQSGGLEYGQMLVLMTQTPVGDMLTDAL
jgi:hypothetical protein